MNFCHMLLNQKGAEQSQGNQRKYQEEKIDLIFCFHDNCSVMVTTFIVVSYQKSLLLAILPLLLLNFFALLKILPNFFY